MQAAEANGRRRSHPRETGASARHRRAHSPGGDVRARQVSPRRGKIIGELTITLLPDTPARSGDEPADGDASATCADRRSPPRPSSCGRRRRATRGGDARADAPRRRRRRSAAAAAKNAAAAASRPPDPRLSRPLLGIRAGSAVVRGAIRASRAPAWAKARSPPPRGTRRLGGMERRDPISSPSPGLRRPTRLSTPARRRSGRPPPQQRQRQRPRCERATIPATCTTSRVGEGWRTTESFVAVDRPELPPEVSPPRRASRRPGCRARRRPRRRRRAGWDPGTLRNPRFGVAEGFEQAVE